MPVIHLPLKTSGSAWGTALVFYLLLLQNPLEGLLPAARFLDELLAASGLVFCLPRILRRGRIRMLPSTLAGNCAFGIFLLSGLLGNLLWEYQPLGTVMTDLYTNMKFFLALISGGSLLRRDSGVTAYHARVASTVLFLLLLLDQTLHLFPGGEMRYGLRVSQLLYSHPTYLAGAAVFLLAVLTANYRSGDGRYLLMTLTVLFFTLRGKAIAGAAIYAVLFYLLLWRRKKLKLRHIFLLALAALAAAGKQFFYYYVTLRGRSARSVLTQTAVRIAGDYFPIGTGFGTYASHVAADPYSPVYVKYGFLSHPELGGGTAFFYDDTFFPILLGQTGILGTVSYCLVLGILFWRITQLRKHSISAYAAGVFVCFYLLVSATSEPAFNNALAIPLAMVLGWILHGREEPG